LEAAYIRELENAKTLIAKRTTPAAPKAFSEADYVDEQPAISADTFDIPQEFLSEKADNDGK
jgi:hypothetical protein